MEDCAVVLNDVAKAFRAPEGHRIEAVRKVSLSIRTNEFMTLLGPSGCGKTTLLRLIGGFEIPDSGEIVVGGASMAHAPPYLRPVNTMFQSYALFPHMTVEQNLAYGLETKSIGKAERMRRVGEALELVSLAGMGLRKPHQLSGGQQSRVALARAVINRPQVLLLDEPLAALDRKLRQNMGVELKNLQHELGITFLCVTHDQEEALTMSDRIAVMSDGEISQVGSVDEIYERPRNRFIANFIGDSNIFTGKIVGVNEGLAQVRCDSGVDLTFRHNGAARIGTTVELLLRPEKLQLLGTLDAEPDVALPRGLCRLDGRLVQSIYLGVDVQLIVSIGNGQKVKLRCRSNHERNLSDLSVGDRLILGYGTDAPHLLATRD